MYRFNKAGKKLAEAFLSLRKREKLDAHVVGNA
jgi:hypothetical protein